jgi:putative flippase GtrA
MGSVITTMVSFIAIAILYGFKILPGIMSATLTGNAIASVPAYYLNRTWTWGKRGKSHWRTEIIPFWSMSVAGIAFSQLGAALAKHIVHQHHWNRLIDTGLVTGSNLVCFVVFWFIKLFVFNRIFHVSKLEQMDEHLTAEEKGEI